MSVLQVYLSWANSVLCEVNTSVDSVSAIQEGRVLCELIDVLAPEAGLLDKVQATGGGKQRAYIHSALDHMKNHGIKIIFSTQDIMDGDIKSLLDVMWLLILNYGIHFIGDNSFQRTVGVGKKALLEWCQGELDVTFDPKNTLAINLCTGSWFTQLLQVFAGSHIEETEDKVGHLHKLLQEIEERYGIKHSIISPSDIVDGTVDEHTLMIFLSLLKRRVCSTVRSARREMLSVDGKEAALARVEERNRSMSAEVENRRRYSEQMVMHKQFLQLQHQQQQQQQQHQQQELQEHEQQSEYKDQEQQPREHAGRSSRALSLDSSLARPREALQSRSQESLESTWLSSESTSQRSGQDKSPGDRKSSLVREAEQVLLQTISEKIHEHMPGSDHDEDKDTDVSPGLSESLSEMSSGAFDEGYATLRNETSPSKTVHENPKDTERTKSAGSRGADEVTDSKTNAKTEKPVQIKISRPKDYFLQWEETIDRLSHGPSAASDVSDMSPRSPRQILRGIGHTRSPRSHSETDDLDLSGEPVWKRREYFEKRSGPRSAGSGELRHLSRSTSMPARSDLSMKGMSAGSQDRLHQSIESRRKTRSSRTGEDLRRTGESRHGGRNSKDTSPGTRDNSRQELSSQAGNYKSNFMNTLEELQKSGGAKRVILPELGPDTPVVMVPAQGKDMLLLFDALRQARLDVDVKVAPGEGMTEGTNHAVTNGRKTPTRSSPTQQSEDTEVKEVRQKEKRQKEKRNNTVSGSSATRQEGEDTVSSLPRPTAHKHRVPKPLDIRVADLRSGKVRDPRRTQSLTDRQFVSPLVAPTGSSRYHSLSPGREQTLTSPSDLRDSSAQSPVDRSEASSRAVSLERSDNAEDILDSSRDSIQGSPGFRSVARRSSPYASPYRATNHRPLNHSLSPRRAGSPRYNPAAGMTAERPPPLELPEDLVSPRPRAGGLGRVPRREAWERQRRRKEIQSLDKGGTESTAQARFIEVLYKEIEELKKKIEVMEDSQAESSPERTSPQRRWRAVTGTPTPPPTSAGNNDSLFSAQSEIRELENTMVLARRGTSPRLSVHKFRQSPRHWETSRSTSSPRLSPGYRPVQISLSPRRLYARTSPLGTLQGRQSPSPLRRSGSDVSPRPRSISLGYKSPIRSVTQEIWGGDLTDTDSPPSERRDHFRKLISQTALGEGDIIELKQALASSVVENDILQAKLRNARFEIQEKLNKTNEVLDDCRKHLARSQAENMELRTALEREKDRVHKSDSYCSDMRQMVQQVRADNHELEEELGHTVAILDQSRPGLEALKQQNEKLRGRAVHVQNENSSLKREMEDMRKSHFRSVNTIRELRHLLDEVREERSNLQKQLHNLQRSHSESQVRSSLVQYGQEKGARDEVESEHAPAVGIGSSEKFQSSQTPRRSSSLKGDSGRSTSSIPQKGSASYPRQVSPPRGLSYRLEDMSPVVPSTYREIYPHRKPRYQGSSWDTYTSPERHDSPVAFIDYPDLQHFPTKLDSYPTHDDRPSYRHSPTGSASIYKPIPYRPYPTDPAQLSTFPERTVVQSARESRGRSPPMSRGRSPARTSPNFRDIRSASSSPGMPRDRLSRSQDSALYTGQRSASCSPGRHEDSRRGILKRGGSREGSPSPRYGSRSHSPPTRLSPELRGEKGASKKRLTFSPADLQWGPEKPAVDQLRQKHSSTSWLHLQFPPSDSHAGLQMDATQPGMFSRDEHLLLSDDQRRYANSLIRKYTGINP